MSSIQGIEIVLPLSKHLQTIIMLHGFTGSGATFVRGWHGDHKHCWLDDMRKANPKGCDSTKFVFPTATERLISCYGEPKPSYNAWHDYLTDHGGDEGRPDIEEEINREDLAATRNSIHELIRKEVALLGGDASRVAVGGASQGGCVALDVALSYPETLGACIVSFGHIYSCSHTPSEREALPIFHFHGAEDEVIACSLAERGWERLREAGFGSLSLHVAPGLTHCAHSARETELCGEQLRQRGFW